MSDSDRSRLTALAEKHRPFTIKSGCGTRPDVRQECRTCLQAWPCDASALLAELAEKDAEIERLMSDRAKAGRAIYEAQRPAFALLESSGAPKVENRERTPEQAALVELYSLVHNAAKLLVGRRDIEHNDLTEANALASEWRMEYATMRSERDAAEVRASTAEAALAKVREAIDLALIMASQMDDNTAEILVGAHDIAAAGLVVGVHDKEGR